ncbi:MAG: hypothetical protein JOS17DRAFT_132106 [Linnemannia elongata]|nr:MAG: hypothetical protein JOS17DRAFT_132106 [Linnemannia elongata]
MGQSSWTITPRFYSSPLSPLPFPFSHLTCPFLPLLHNLFLSSFSFAFVVKVRICLFCFVLDLDSDRSYPAIIVEDPCLPIVQKRDQLASQSNLTISWRVVTPPPLSSPTSLPLFLISTLFCDWEAGIGGHSTCFGYAYRVHPGEEGPGDQHVPGLGFTKSGHRERESERESESERRMYLRRENESEETKKTTAVSFLFLCGFLYDVFIADHEPWCPVLCCTSLHVSFPLFSLPFSPFFQSTLITISFCITSSTGETARRPWTLFVPRGLSS